MTAPRANGHTFLHLSPADRARASFGTSDQPKYPENHVGKEPQEHDDPYTDRSADRCSCLTDLELLAAPSLGLYEQERQLVEVSVLNAKSSILGEPSPGVDKDADDRSVPTIIERRPLAGFQEIAELIFS